MSVLKTVEVAKSFGGLRALQGVDIAVESGQVVGLIGPNGAGKSTLLSILAGEQAPTSGQVLLDDAAISRANATRRSRLGVARTFQNLRLFKESTVFENVVVASRRWRDPAFRGHRRHAVGEQANAILERVGLAPELWSRPAGSLPYIQQRLLEIARCLATEPRFLLLDEPVAGANDQERGDMAELVRQIAAQQVGIVLIEHDMPFLFGLAEQITVLDHGEVISSGNAAEIQRDQAVIDAYLGTVEE